MYSDEYRAVCLNNTERKAKPMNELDAKHGYDQRRDKIANYVIPNQERTMFYLAFLTT